MKSSRIGFFSVLVAAALCVGVPVAALMNAGCASKPSTEQTAYKTLHGVGITANTAVDTWLKYFLLESADLKKQVESPARSKKLEDLTIQDLQVQKVYSMFSSSYNTALTAVQMNATNLAPADVSKLCVELTGLVVQFTSSN